LSFTEGARELHVSQAAISRHVRAAFVAWLDGETQGQQAAFN
jgi:DNA-binding transcriptional LysR family regulator